MVVHCKFAMYRTCIVLLVLYFCRFMCGRIKAKISATCAIKCQVCCMAISAKTYKEIYKNFSWLIEQPFKTLCQEFLLNLLLILKGVALTYTMYSDLHPQSNEKCFIVFYINLTHLLNKQTGFFDKMCQ